MTSRPAVVGLLLSVLLVACDPGAREAEPFQGNWWSEAWGIHLSISGGSVEIFESSEVHCFSTTSGGARGIDDVLTRDGDDLVLVDDGRTIHFAAIEFLPEACAGPVLDDAGTTYDVLAATFENHYAPGLDEAWSQRVETLRPESDAALFEAVTSLLGPLARPDVRIAAADATWAAATVDPVDLADGQEFGLGGVVTGAPGGFGYLGFRRLGGFASDSEASQRVAADAIDAAVAATDSLILDLRVSDGGSIDHAMLIASRIVPDAGRVATLSADGPSGLVPAGEASVRPLPTGTFQGSVAVLVGPGTIGVAELLAAALHGVDGVTLIGNPTAGSPGPGMVRFLPNGWSVGLPNLNVTLADGSELSDGVIPDVQTDDALATAMRLLQE